MNVKLHDALIICVLLLFIPKQVHFVVCAVNSADCLCFPIREGLFGMLDFSHFRYQYYVFILQAFYIRKAYASCSAFERLILS